MGFARAFLTLSLIYVIFTIASSTAKTQTFKCTSSGRKCNALIDYVSPNTTTLSTIKALFGIKHLRSLLGANNLPLSTPSSQTVSAQQTIKIPFPCMCTNGTGISNHVPVYKVVAGDFLFHIATEVFSRLVTYQQIQAVNRIEDESLIEVDQELWIPLPCSCDEVDGESVVHYGHAVASGSTVDAIAQEYNISAETLLRVNGLDSPSDLKAEVPFDVPLKVNMKLLLS
ncbi:hypothetical protein F0562_020937 [Nyssa sinensis]|uniref:LysM domain-containing protein n=1 Tax=Nyssa sinensis TaxID=561372 RepID=A0A5J5BTC5_9ASTE|nr:hypothetical protein F0562_020937 [Nyssa sinensis]